MTTPNKSFSAMGVYGKLASESWKKWVVGTAVVFVIVAILVLTNDELTTTECLYATGSSALCSY